MSRKHNIFGGAPVLSLLVPFTAGIALQYYQDCGLSVISILFALSFSSSLLVLYYAERSLFKRCLPALLFLTLTSVGMMALYTRQAYRQDHHIERVYQKGEAWLGIIGTKEHTKTYTRFIIHFKRVGQHNKPVQGKGILYSYDSTLNKTLHIGDCVQSEAELIPIQSKGNPAEFDLKGYYARKGISRQIFIRNRNILRYKHCNNPSFIYSTTQKIQQTIRDILDRAILSKKETVIAKALLTGQENNKIDPATRQAYVQAGIVHVLVISGLHIGVLSLLVSILIRPFAHQKRRFWRIFAIGIQLFCIWLFCLVAGMGVSVLRAGIMFSFIHINSLIRSHKQNRFQALAVGAFIILMLDPYALWSLGFQYSFLALLGIFLMLPIITRWSQKIPFILCKKVAQICLVSLAANLFLIPLSMLIFGKFYPYFILSNIVAIPLASTILYGEVGIVLTAFIPFVSEAIGSICQRLIRLLGSIVDYLNTFPQSEMHLYLTPVEYVLYSLAVACLSFYLLQRQKRQFYVGFFLLSAGVFLSVVGNYQSKTRYQLCVLHSNKHEPTIALIQGKHATLYATNSQFLKSKNVHFMLQGLEKRFHLNSVEKKTYEANTSLHIYQHGSKRIALMHNLQSLDNYKLQIDSCDVIILPSSIKRVEYKQYKDNQKLVCYDCRASEKVKIHILKKQGAFIIDATD